MAAPGTERPDRRLPKGAGDIARDARRERAEDLAELFGFGFTTRASVVCLRPATDGQRAPQNGSVRRLG